MDIKKEIKEIYGLEGELIPFGNGHINDTYKCGDYVVQKINENVFKDPERLMENVITVTDHIKKAVIKEGKDPEKYTLSIVPTLDQKPYCRLSDGSFFRVTKYIANTVSYDEVNPTLLYKAAYGFGKFQNMLSDLNGRSLHETIKDFHNTPARYEALLRAVKADVCGRVSKVAPELEYLASVKDEYSVITAALESGALPTRVTHNDTKINNVLFDKDSGEFVAVVDLDTVMPGSLLYDYGDAVRFAVNAAAEDEPDLSKVGILYDNFKAFTKGFLDAMGSGITPLEKELLVFSARLLTLELVIRFLTDYIEGDVYFKISRENHNLDRARCQLRFAQLIGENKEKLNDIVYGKK